MAQNDTDVVNTHSFKICLYALTLATSGWLMGIARSQGPFEEPEWGQRGGGFGELSSLAVEGYDEEELRVSEALPGNEPVNDQAVRPLNWILPAEAQEWTPGYEVGAEFDRGIFIRSTDLEERPFSLYVGGRIQLRYIGFTRDEETWTDSAGITRPIRNRNQFDLERARLNFSGTAIDPDLTYMVVLDADGDGGSLTDGLIFYFNYEFDPAFNVRVGRWKTASSREWLLSSRHLRLADRSLATEFFRVGFSDGIWFLGDFEMLGMDGWHYETSLTNGLRSSTRESGDLDDNLAVAGTMFCDPLGEFGFGETDFQNHETPVVRFGGSFAYDKSDDRSDAGVTFVLGDNNFVRLSDGTLINETGALAPGVTLLSDRIIVSSLDFAAKYRGWSFSSEYFMRSIFDLTATGPLPMNDLYTYGFRAEAGKFIVPQKFDINCRMSQVSGMYGNSFEYACGMNYYLGCETDIVNKLTFDVSRIKHSAAESTLADIYAGDDGVLFRGQIQLGF